MTLMLKVSEAEQGRSIQIKPTEEKKESYHTHAVLMRILKYFWTAERMESDIKFAPQTAKDSVSEHNGEGQARMQCKLQTKAIYIFMQNDL